MKNLVKRLLFLSALIIHVILISIVCYAEEETDMIPFYKTDIREGTYEVEIESSSSMFRIVKAELEVTEEAMTAVITLSGTGYLKLYMGTKEEALKAEDKDYIPYVEDGEGAYTYTIPIQVLNQEFSCAAYSKRKETWYDRELTVLASSLPENALLTSATDMIPIPLDTEDGEYRIEVTLAGGSGRASIVSPAKVSISDGTATVFLEWSSPDYDYMILDRQQYLPVNTEGNSVFALPLLALDREVSVIADTIAMSKPHEIAYTLIFHSNTLKKENKTKGADRILFLVGLVCLTGGAAAAFGVKRKKRKQNE